MKACIYLRVSSSVQVDGISLQLQRERLHAYAVAHGWDVVEEYEDAGISGGSTDRPAFQRMLADAKAGKFNVILVYRFDRLSRSVRDFHDLVGQLEEVNVGVVSITQHIDTTSTTGKLMRNILVDFADFERLEIARKTRDAKQRLAAGGRYLGWQPPLGYRKEGERANARLVVVPEEAEIVRRVFSLYLTGQYGDTLIARELGLTANRVRRILLNPTYTGKIAYAKRRGTKKHLTRFDMDEWIISDGEHEAIISEEDFYKALRIREANHRNAGPKRQTSHLFSRLIFCGKCGTRMRLSLSYNPKARYRSYYRCDRRDRKRHCDQRPVKHEAIELTFRRQLEQVVDTPKFWEEAEAEWLRRRQSRPDVDALTASLKARRAQLVRQIDNLVLALADGELAAAIRPRLTALEDERRDVDKKLREIMETAAQQEAVSPVATRELMLDVSRSWRWMTVEEKREGVRLFVEQFTIIDERLGIKWTDPHLPITWVDLPPKYAKIKL